MAFDQGSTKPVIQPAKKTTQVNLWMVVAVVVFLALAAVVTFYFNSHRREAQDGVSQQLQHKP